MAKSSLTFFSKTPIVCPVCESKFYREEMRTGRGRLIAGELTDELRRHYEPSQKYGEVYPLIYSITVCPVCYYAAFPQDFPQVPTDAARRIQQATDERTDAMAEIVGRPDFTEPRDLWHGLASYFYAAACYDYLPKEFSPTFKQGLCSLRSAWICNDLHRKHPDENYDYLGQIFYRKARFFYSLAVERETSGEESIPNDFHLGPDQDKNYGYDGVLYLSGLLDFRYGSRKDREKRKKSLNRAKRTVAKIFGMGRASKNKPQAILDNARDVYEQIAEELGLENRNPEEVDESA
jgi:uncharacterized protein (DUF2225 family)